jgi:hypothetical protein
VKNLGPDPRDLRIEVDWGLAYELVLGLRMFVDTEDPASYSVGASWFRRVRRAAPAELLTSIDRLCGGHEIIFGHLLGLASEAPPPRDAAALLRQLRRTTPLSLRLHLLGSNLQTSRGGVSRQVVGKAARGDAPAIERLLRGTDPDRRPAIEHILALDTREAKRLLIQIVRGWNEAVLSPIADETGPTLRRAAERTRAAYEQLAVDAAVTGDADVAFLLLHGRQGEGGEIFVLDMGKPIKILELARQLIELNGLKPDEDIQIEFIGLRPGEKLFEELSHRRENITPTNHPKILRFVTEPPPLSRVRQLLEELSGELHQMEPNELKLLLKKAVPEYDPFLT